jgi:antitoxin (DNA-binding transcriptional repressor) of toxin-antitoxin stability system
MEIFTVKEFQENFDDLIKRVEKGERIGIIDENGRSSIMIPINDDLMQMDLNSDNKTS